MGSPSQLSSGSPAIAVVSVTYNRYQPLLVLLGQLREQNYDLEKLDIFLVDNASTDDTVAQVTKQFPEVHIIKNAENTGVSAGFNRSIQEALSAPREYKYLWLLDSDAEVEANTLSIMVEAMEHDDGIGVAGSSVYDPHNRQQLVTAGLRVDWQHGDIPLFIPSEEEKAPLLDVDLIPACSMLTRATVYQDIGLWDNRFPLYWGDTDWCMRVLRKGFRVCCAYESRVWHRDWSNVVRRFGASSFIREHLSGALLYFLRHDPDGRQHGVRHLLRKIYLKAALERLTMRFSYSDAYIEAVRDLFAGRFHHSFKEPSQRYSTSELDQLCAELKALLPAQPTVLLNQIADRERRHRIKRIFTRHFDNISWVEIDPEQPPGGVWSEYRTFKPRQLLKHGGRILRGFRRPDLNVCDISTPLMYNFSAGHHTILLDENDNGLAVHTPVVSNLGQMLRTIFEGFKAVYFDLPRALRQSTELITAVSETEPAEHLSVVTHNDRPEY